MVKTVATDMWAWAFNLFEKNSHVQLNFIEKPIFEGYIQGLPHRNFLSSGKVGKRETKIPDYYLQQFNSIDFAKVPKDKEDFLKKFLTDYFKNKKG